MRNAATVWFTSGPGLAIFMSSGCACAVALQSVRMSLAHEAGEMPAPAPRRAETDVSWLPKACQLYLPAAMSVSMRRWLVDCVAKRSAERSSSDMPMRPCAEGCSAGRPSTSSVNVPSTAASAIDAVTEDTK